MEKTHGKETNDDEFWHISKWTALTPVTVPEAGGLLEAAISIKVWILLLQPRGKKEYGVDITTYAVYM